MTAPVVCSKCGGALLLANLNVSLGMVTDLVDFARGLVSVVVISDAPADQLRGAVAAVEQLLILAQDQARELHARIAVRLERAAP